MKKIIWILVATALTTPAIAQKPATKAPAAPVKKPMPATPAKPAEPLIKNSIDSVSYALGVSLAAYYKSQGVLQLNTTLLSKAVSDVLQGKPTLFDNAACNNILNNYMSKIQSEKSKFNREQGELFLVENKKRPEIKTTASGLQYEVLREGSGDQPTAVDTVTCHYRGTFLDGKGFDNSYDRGQPISFPLTGVIRGWTEGLQLMKTGAKYRFYIPYTLGYGENDYMSIPGGSMLIFEVELIEVKRQR